MWPTQDLNYERLEKLKQSHPTWRLLNADNAPFIFNLTSAIETVARAANMLNSCSQKVSTTEVRLNISSLIFVKYFHLLEVSYKTLKN